MSPVEAFFSWEWRPVNRAQHCKTGENLARWSLGEVMSVATPISTSWLPDLWRKDTIICWLQIKGTYHVFEVINPTLQGVATQLVQSSEGHSTVQLFQGVGRHDDISKLCGGEAVGALVRFLLEAMLCDIIDTVDQCKKRRNSCGSCRLDSDLAIKSWI